MAKKETEQQPQNGQPSSSAPLQIYAQYIKDLSFENPNSPESLLSNWDRPETHIEVNIQYRPLKEATNAENTYEVLLLFRIEAKNKEKDKTAFIIELAYGATVALGNIPEEHTEPVLMVEVPKVLFPFAREIIATASHQGGFPTLYMQPINFEGVYIQRLQQQQAEKGEGKNSDSKKTTAKA